ncbi:MAG: MATE family efflux transporter [Gemmatimonadales bacterium]|nr:MATE family efflux transporter [Gemmatimonadales bacterium]
MTAAPQRGFDRSLVEGPIARAVWLLAWPTMLQNVIGGLQGVVDHAMVGHFVGYTANAAIGVSLQIFLVVIVFIASLYSGMGVLVARFAGAGDVDKVNRTVYQAFLASLGMSAIFAPLGYVLAPPLLTLVNATPEVRAEALPYLRLMFGASIGMLLFFMFGGALRSAGDARTPLRLGVLLTVLNIGFNLLLIPRLGTAGAALGTVFAGAIVSGIAISLMFSGRLVVSWPKGLDKRPDWDIIRQLFRFGLPTGVQGIAMNIGGVLMLRFIGSVQYSAEAQAAYAVGYTELFSLITWTSVGLMGAAAAVAGQNLGAGRPDRSIRAVHRAAGIGLGVAVVVGTLFLAMPGRLLALFGMDDPTAVGIGTTLLTYLSVSGLFITVALTYTGGLQGTGDTRSPLYISIMSQVVVPLGLCAGWEAMRRGAGEPGLRPTDIWTAILIGHATRCALSVLRFRQGRWRDIAVDIPSRPPSS